MREQLLQPGEALRQQMLANLGCFPRLAVAAESLKPAAVAVVIAENADARASFLLTRRAPRLRAHAGQWALPGGRIEAGEDAPCAALRELSEEIGLELAPKAVIGMLDDYPTRSGYLITPVVIWYGKRATFVPNPHEVAAAYSIPLAALGRPEVPRLSRIPESDRPLIQVPIAELEVAVHAPTAAILYQLWEVAVQGRTTRVAHFEQPRFAWS